MIKLKEVMANDMPPPYKRWDNPDTELDLALRSPFTALDYALRNGPNHKLWQVIKGSPYESQYAAKFGQN